MRRKEYLSLKSREGLPKPHPLITYCLALKGSVKFPMITIVMSAQISTVCVYIIKLR